MPVIVNVVLQHAAEIYLYSDTIRLCVKVCPIVVLPYCENAPSPQATGSVMCDVK